LVASRVTNLVPERRAPEGVFDHLVHVAAEAEHPRTKGDVVVDRLGERVRLLEHHPDALAHLDRVDPGGIQICAAV
jgi:hypothetical protein